MTDRWPMVRLGDTLELQRRWLQPEPDRPFYRTYPHLLDPGIHHALRDESALPGRLNALGVTW